MSAGSEETIYVRQPVQQSMCNDPVCLGHRHSKLRHLWVAPCRPPRVSLFHLRGTRGDANSMTLTGGPIVSAGALALVDQVVASPAAEVLAASWQEQLGHAAAAGLAVDRQRTDQPPADPAEAGPRAGQPDTIADGLRA